MTVDDSYEDWTPCVHCRQNERTSELFYGTICQGCEQYWKISHSVINPSVSCNGNFKRKPWRRKSLLNRISRWSWLNSVPLTLLLQILLTNLVQGVSHFLCRTTSLNRNLIPFWGFLFITLFGGISLPLVSCQESLQPSSSLKSLQLPNAVAYVGSAFTYNISENVFDCKVDSIVVSENADRFLSHWLAYNSEKKQLYGVPTEKDTGTYNLLVVALMQDGKIGGHVCGSQSFFVKVLPLSEQLPASVYIGTGNSGKDDKLSFRSPCVPGAQVVQATAVLNADVEVLNGHQRMTLILKMADHLNVHSSRVSFFPGQTSHPIIEQLDNPAVMAAGAGDGRFAKGFRSLLTWHVGCGAIRLDDLALSKLEADAQDGTISSLLGIPVVGWHVMSGTQRNQARRRVRRQVMGVTATPTESSRPPSRMSNVSTFVIVSLTATLRSVSNDSLTIQLSTSPVSTMAPNRTNVRSSVINMNSTVASEPLSRTDILSSSTANISRSTVGISSSILLTQTSVLNSSSVVLSRNFTASVQSSTVVYSTDRTSLLMLSSLFTPSPNSTFITRAATKIVSSVISSLSLLTSTMNSSSTLMSPNLTTANVSHPTTFSSVSSTRLVTSSTFSTSFSSQFLAPSTTQVGNRSAVSSTSASFAVPTSRPVSLVFSSSPLSTASPNLTALPLTSETTRTLQLNSTTSTAMPLTVTTSVKLSPTRSILSTFASSVNSSFLITSSVNKTSSSTRSHASLSLFSSLVTPSETTFVGNASSSVAVSSFGTSLLVMNSTTVLNRTSRVLTLTSTSIVPTMTGIVPTMTGIVTNTTSFVASLFNSSTTTLSSSLSQLSSHVLLSSSSVIMSLSTVLENFTSSSLQLNISSTAVFHSSLTASPVFTSLNSASMMTSVNASTAGSSVLVNSTSKIDRSSLSMITTSVFSPIRTSRSRTFPTTSASYSPTTTEVGISSVNTTGAPVMSTNASSAATSLVTSFFARSTFISEFTSSKTSDSSVTQSFPGISSFGVNSTISSRTHETVSSAVTPLANLSIRSIPTPAIFTTLSTQAVMSTTFIPTSMKLFPNGSLSSRTVLPSSTVLLLNSSSVLNVSESKVSVTVVASSLLDTTGLLAPTTVVSSAIDFTASSRGKGTTLISSATVRFVSSSFVFNSSLVVRSSFGVSSIASENQFSATVTPTPTVGLPTSVTVTPSSLHSRNVSTVASFMGVPSSYSISTPVFTRSAPRSALVTSVTSRLPSSAQLTATTVVPVNRTAASSVETNGTFPSSSTVLPSSNTTRILTPRGSVVTFSVTPSSGIVIPTTAPPNSPPRLINDMGRIRAPAGKALYLTIPADTFYDSEDQATTRSLSLSVFHANGESIPSNFWLQFDNSTQTIYGLPISSHVPTGVIGEGFILRAQDSQGAEAFDAFEVLVVPSEEPVVQELRIRIANDFLAFSRNVSERLLLLDKIAVYYGDADISRIRVLSFTSGSVIMTWTNDSLPTERCDEEKVEYVANKVLADGAVREEFKEALQGFPVESGSQTRLGVCNRTKPDGGATIAPAQQSQGEGDLWYKHVLVGVLVVLIILVLVGLMIWYCRRRRPKPFNEKRTYKKRKPIILEPEIELKPMPRKPLVLPDEDLSQPPYYMSETSLDKPVSSYEDDDKVDHGRRSPLVRYEPPPPFHPTLDDDPWNSPPPAYMMPPLY